MANSNKKYSYEVDEATELKVKSMLGKSYLQTRDYQHIIQVAINQLYEKSKGKKI